jgi:hypothetical protein
VKMAWQPRRPVTPSYQAMARSHQLDTSLEVLTNLVYLIRLTLDDPTKATKYLDLADQMLIDIAASPRHHLLHSPRD